MSEKTIQLTKGYSTKVDAEDYERFATKMWQARVQKGCEHLVRAVRSEWRDGKRVAVYLSREIMNAPKGKVVDHINGDALDNRKSNLRICTQAQNMANTRLSKRNTSGVKGVCWFKPASRWRAEIMVNRKKIFLGNFERLEDAKKAYERASVKHFKEFARVK